MVARIITDNQFDVVAIQEVRDRDGAGVDRLLNTLGPPCAGTKLGGEPFRRAVGIVYRGDRVGGVWPARPWGSELRVFERVSLAPRFRAGTFDFELITAHLSWGDTAQRQEEMRTLAGLIATRHSHRPRKI